MVVNLRWPSISLARVMYAGRNSREKKEINCARTGWLLSPEDEVILMADNIEVCYKGEISALTIAKVLHLHLHAPGVF